MIELFREACRVQRIERYIRRGTVEQELRRETCSLGATSMKFGVREKSQGLREALRHSAHHVEVCFISPHAELMRGYCQRLVHIRRMLHGQRWTLLHAAPFVRVLGENINQVMNFCDASR